MQHASKQALAFPLGLALLGGLLVQLSVGWIWPWLGRLQEGELYMQLSGFVLLALVIHQWQLSVLRIRRRSQQAAQQAGVHTLIGALAPALFFLHAQQPGYGYLAALSLTFIGVMATGLLNLELPAGQPRWLRPARVSLHVGLATALLLTLSYHVLISYEFE